MNAIPPLSPIAQIADSDVVVAAYGSIPAGWYADPGNARAMRWWDGQQWTDHVHATPDPAAVYQPEPTHVLAQSPSPEPARVQHVAPARKRAAVLAASVAAVVAVAAVGAVTFAHGGKSQTPPAIADAESACRSAFQATYERGDQEVKARYAREEPDFFFRTSMDAVHVWSSATVGSSVVVDGDVEWTLTTGVLGSHTQTNKYSCTASMRNGQLVTRVF